jgi:hypothetical protein
MKTKLLLCALLATAAPLAAAPLASTTAVHTKPDEASPSVTFLKAGTDPIPVTDSLATTPAGWMAVEMAGPFEGYVQDKELTKDLDMKPGAPIYLAPKLESGVLTTAEKGDKTNITGQRSRWLQIRLERKLNGYIFIGGTPGYLPPIATTPAGSSAAAPSGPAPMAAAPIAPVAYGAAEAGRAAPMVNPSDSASALPRQFLGHLAYTQRPLRPRRPYDWALNDDAGKRYAYLDVTKLLLSQPLEALADHDIVVYGAPRGSADGKDLVITVETMQLK